MARNHKSSGMGNRDILLLSLILKVNFVTGVYV